MKKCIKWGCGITLLILLIVALIIPVLAGSPWQQTSGPIGFLPYAVAIDPTNSKNIYVGTSNSGVYKSTDGGITWNFVDNGLPNSRGNGLPNNVVCDSLAIDPTGQTIYESSSGWGVYKSSNAGVSWNAVNSGLDAVNAGALAIDPQNSQTVYLATINNGVYKSTNGGASWAVSTTGMTNTDIASIAIDPTNNQIIYAGATAYNSYIGGVFKSIDGGATWNAVNTGMITSGVPFVTVTSLAIDSTGIVYAGTNFGMFKSNNGGNSWSAIDTGLGNLNFTIFSLAIDPNDNQTIYAGTNVGSVFNSTNGGNSWNVVASGLTSTMIYYTNGAVAWTSIPGLTISGTPSTTATVGTPYSFTPTATNTSSFSYTGILPPGLNFNSANGSITGTPTAAGSYQNIVITANNASGSASLLPFSITVNQLAPTISGNPSISATLGIPYSFTPTSTNATSFSITGALPPGLSFSTSTGAISGTPTNTGTYGNIQITANNGSGSASLTAFTITVTLGPAPAIGGTPSSSATIGSVYSFTPTSTNAASFGCTGTLPPGLSFNTTTGMLSGTPTTAGIYNNIVITVTNASGSASLPAFSITVSYGAAPKVPAGGFGMSLFTALIIAGYGLWRCRKPEI